MGGSSWMLHLVTAVLAFVPFFSGAAEVEPSDPVQFDDRSIHAHLIEPGGKHFRFLDSALVPNRPDHPPIHLIPEIKLPHRDNGVRAIEQSTPVLVRDLEAGTTTEIAPAEFAGEDLTEWPGWNGPDAGNGGIAEEYSKGFSDLTKITDTSIFPWRMNAKLVMKFQDVEDEIHYAVCSGVMVDAETVLTAGHCVYAHTMVVDGASVVVNDWAQNVWVYPGWTGEGGGSHDLPDPTQVIEPYGYGSGNSSAASPGWVYSKNYDEDLGLVRINRAVGMLTGWFGTATGGSCSWIQDRNYYNASYPAEYCGQPTMYNGLSMYYWFGVFDSCPDNQLRILVNGGCESNGWQGMSGSGAYYIDNNVRFVHAVASTRDPDVDVDFCRITSFWSGWMHDTFIPMSRGAVFDLQALDVTGPDSMIFAGNDLPGATVFVTNPTNGSGSGPWTFRAYLSTDSYITDSDLLLGTYSFNVDFNPMESWRVTMDPLPVIPLNTPSSFYYLGVILDPGTDSDPDNNASLRWDTQFFSVMGVSDLEAEAFDAQPGTFRIGDDIQVYFKVSNLGGYHSNPFTVEVRASLNTYITTSDPLLGALDYPALDGGTHLMDWVQVTIPDTIYSGNYYVGINVVDASDHDPDNNTAYDPVQVTVEGYNIFVDGFENGDTSGWSSRIP